MEVRRLDMDEWDRVLPPAGFDVFHTTEALSILDDHTQSELRLYGGFKGQEPVGLLPVFVRKNAVGRVASSPPPSMGIPYLGPVMMPTSPKRRKRERANQDFSREMMEELNLNSRRTLFRMITSPDYSDPRPFLWDDLSVEPRFTYLVEIPPDPEDLLDQFSADLRRNIRKVQDSDLSVAVEDGTAAERVAGDVRTRYEAQDHDPPFTVEYVRDLVSGLEYRARPYVARDPQGDYIGGIIVLYSNDRAYFWQGGVRRDYEGISVNSLLHWHIMQDVATEPPTESVTSYDLVGANTERLCSYKAKFGGQLVPYYAIESAGPGMDVAKAAYRVVGT